MDMAWENRGRLCKREKEHWVLVHIILSSKGPSMKYLCTPDRQEAIILISEINFWAYVVELCIIIIIFSFSRCSWLKLKRGCQNTSYGEPENKKWLLCVDSWHATEH